MVLKYLICFSLLLHFYTKAVGPAEAGNALPPINIITSEYAPFNYLEEGQPKGFCTEIVQALLKELKISTPITYLPWARAYQTALKQENTLIFTIARTREREHKFQWVGVLVTGKSYLFSLKDRFIRPGSLDQIHSFRIGATRNDIRAKFLFTKGKMDLDLVVDSRMNAVKLLNQRIDLWAEDELAAVYTIRQLGYDPAKVLFKSLPLDLHPVPKGYLAFSRKTDKNLVQIFRNRLKQLIQTPEYKAIQKKYIHTPLK